MKPARHTSSTRARCNSDTTSLSYASRWRVNKATLVQILKKSMGEAVWCEKEILALDYLKERLPSLPTELTSDAWLGVEVK